MKWVKLHVTLRHNRAFRGLSVNAKVAFICGLMAAADYDQGGALCLRQRKLTEVELAEDLMLSPRAARLAILELVNMGFFIERPDGVFLIDKWDEKCGEDSFLEAHRVRQQRYRERKKLESLRDAVDDVVSVTRDVTRASQPLRHNVTDKEEEVDIPKGKPLGSRASKSTTDPEWPKTLKSAVYALGDRSLASLSVDERFLAARYHCLVFGNCTKNEMSNKAKATQVAAGLASLSRNETYGKLKVREYFTAGKTVHEQREKKPWFDVSYIRSVLRFE